MNPKIDQKNVRNFCVIAHIDHGKSTLSDRLIESTGAVEERLLIEQHLDTLDIERKRGITVKSQPMHMVYFDQRSKQHYALNLIDTPGHVDFGYEVSRSMSACEGALLVVDATQGIEAQTVANINLAKQSNLTIIPVINKVDLSSAEPLSVANEISTTFGIDTKNAVMVSAKTGVGVDELLRAIVERIEPPKGDLKKPLKALIFDCKYDSYKGVIAYLRVVDGELNLANKLYLMRSKVQFEPLEIGFLSPGQTPKQAILSGSVGYLATGIKSVANVQVGDTLTTHINGATSPLEGYIPRQPVVFAGVYPVLSDDYLELRDALEKLRLNDSALWFEPENSGALGFGFRCGFLGMLHWEVVQERLENEFNLKLIATAPNVKHTVLLKNGSSTVVDNPAKLPPRETIDVIKEPWVRITTIVPNDYIGPVMDLLSKMRGEFISLDYLQSNQTRVIVKYDMPFSEMLLDFHDRLKSASSGYASMNYEQSGEKPSDLVKLDVLVNHTPIDSLASLTIRERAPYIGRALVAKLKSAIPRQMFEIPIQAAIGNKVLARENIKALRKNVLAKCYGGDVTRKRKLLEKQAEGKKRMKRVGKVNVPQEAFMAILGVKRSSSE